MYTYVTCDVCTYTRRRAGETRWWRERCVERNISVYLGWDVECIVYAETCDSSVYHWRLNQKFNNNHKESRENNKSGKFHVSWKASIFNNPISLLCLWYVHVLWVSLVLRWVTVCGLRQLHLLSLVRRGMSIAQGTENNRSLNSFVQ